MKYKIAVISSKSNISFKGCNVFSEFMLYLAMLLTDLGFRDCDLIKEIGNDIKVKQYERDFFSKSVQTNNTPIEEIIINKEVSKNLQFEVLRRTKHQNDIKEMLKLN